MSEAAIPASPVSEIVTQLIESGVHFGKFHFSAAHKNGLVSQVPVLADDTFSIFLMIDACADAKIFFFHTLLFF